MVVMPGSTLSTGTDTELKKLFALLANSASEAIGSLIGRDLILEPAEMSLTTRDQILESSSTGHAAIRGSLGQDYSDRSFLTLVEIADARVMSGMIMMTPDEIIEQNRNQGTLEGEELAAFGELGNVLCAGLGDTLREAVPNVDIRLQDHALLGPDAASNELLSAGSLACCKLEIKVGDYPSGTAFFVLDQVTAEAWNKGPLTAASAGSSLEAADTDPEDLNGAPARGIVNSYGTSTAAMKLLRGCCRHLGLELRRHSPAQIPNPAAHPGEIVLIDVPSYEERRIDWCRRIKDYGSTTKVALLLHRPCRSLVKKAYLSKADVILGMPIDEKQMANKLAQFIEP